jgi:iron complex outermembrane recepter protein
MRKTYLLLLSSVLTIGLNAQNVSGLIKDDKNKPSDGTTVSLLRAKDSSTIKYSVTKADGKFLFAGVKEGDYLISTSHVGYAPTYSPRITVAGSDVQMPELALVKSTGDLKGVTVTARKPMVEVKADKTILNVEGTINATGSDALELLRKSPGVLVDKDENLSLSGKNGVQVYIDGRPTPLAGKDLSDYLKTLQSEQIESIEIITNPSAKYEAAGNAGIINIRLKKNKAFGTNGSVSAGWNQGEFPKLTSGLSLNHRNKNINLFGNYNYNRNKNANYMDLYRIQLDTLFDQHSDMLNRNEGHNFKTGMDYTLSRRSSVGAIVNGTFADVDFENSSRTAISYEPTGAMVKHLAADNTNAMSRKHLNFNLNYRYADTAGLELNVDGDYGLYRNKGNQWQPNIYYDQSGQHETHRLVYNMIAPTDIDIFSVKADYEQNFKKGKLGLGGKVSFVETDNDFQRYNVYTSAKTLDTLRSNRFAYTENINAVYVNYNRAFKGFMIQGGLRMENTTSKGHSSGFKKVGDNYESYDSTFKRPYTDFFPSAAITFNKNPKSQVSLSYSRRIDRPAYQDLNPFEFKLDEYTFMKGNTELRPQYTNSFGITHTYKFKLNTTLNYSHVKDIFSQLIDTTEKSKSFMTKKNLATQDIVSLNVNYPFQYKSFSSFANLNTYYSHYQADFGTGRTIDLDVYAFNLYAQNSLKFGKTKTWSAELSGFYNSPSIWQGTFESIAMWGVDAGMQKQVFKGKGTVKMVFTDLFNTMHWGGTSNFAGQYMRVSGGWESQQLRMNFTYRFGNAQVKAARQRKSATEEEKKRAEGGGGTGIGQ